MNQTECLEHTLDRLLRMWDYSKEFYQQPHLKLPQCKREMEDGDITTDWGPITWYEHEHRYPDPSFLEIYIRLNTEDLEAKPFRMF